MGSEIYESDDEDEDSEPDVSPATSSSSAVGTIPTYGQNPLPMPQLPRKPATMTTPAAVTAVVHPQPTTTQAPSKTPSSLGSTNHIIPGLPASLTAHQTQPPHFNVATHQKPNDVKME